MMVDSNKMNDNVETKKYPSGSVGGLSVDSFVGGDSIDGTCSMYK